MFARYGGYICVCCGETEPLFLTLDHLNDDGAAHRRSINRGSNHGVGYRQMYTAVKKAGFPPILQVLCFNCNNGRERNGGVCPHRIKL